MSLAVCVWEGKTYVSCPDIVASVATPEHPFPLDQLLQQVPFEPDTREDLNDNLWLETSHTHKLLEWYLDAAPSDQLGKVGGLLRSLKVEKANRRKQARKHRWLVAYRQHYVCFKCNKLLHPDAWECDHNVELRDGGTDSFAGVDSWNDNLRALCSNCHAKKTRKRTRDGANEKCQRSSKYFCSR